MSSLNLGEKWNPHLNPATLSLYNSLSRWRNKHHSVQWWACIPSVRYLWQEWDQMLADWSSRHLWLHRTSFSLVRLLCLNPSVTYKLSASDFISISFHAAVNHYRNGRLHPETNKFIKSFYNNSYHIASSARWQYEANLLFWLATRVSKVSHLARLGFPALITRKEKIA